MLSEFVANIFNYDSKIFTTARGLFFPGFLTSQYLDNRRIAYLTLIRLFIFLMFVFFAILSFQNYDQFIMNSNVTQRNNNQDALFNSENLDFNLLEQNYVTLRYQRLIN